MVADATDRFLVANDADMVELPLLLPGWQADALERVAKDAGLTVAQFLRRLVNNSITRHKCETVLVP